MKDFEFYLGEGKVKKQRPDIELGKSLLKDAVERVEKTTILDVKLFSKIIFENVYEALREILDALLFVDGFKSYSHEASISYLKKYGIEDSVMTELDAFRFKRNASKYYGKNILAEETAEIIAFYNRYAPRLITLVKEKIK